MRAPKALAVLLILSALAGCSGGGKGGNGATDGIDVDDGEFDGLDATSTTGVIRGVVVDEAVRPIAGATIAITTLGKNTTSADSGAFGFEGLEPGTYFLEVGKAGFQAVQVSVDVVAGVAEPDIAKVLLVADPDSRPYWVPYQFEGYISCSARYVIEGRNLCGTVDEKDDPLHDIPLEAVPTFAQGELVWESTQALGDELSFNWRRTDTSADYVDIEGPSPLILRANHTLLLENEVGLQEAEDGPQPLRTIVFTAHNQATEPPACLPDTPVTNPVCPWGVGVQLNQQFTLFVHVFYNMLPPEGWTFGTAGDPPQP